MPARHQLIIDADPGIGDAIAIALALSDPNLDVRALTSTGGLVSGRRAFENLQTIVSMVDPDRWPRLGWSDSASVEVDHIPGARKLFAELSSDGLGELQPIAAAPHQPTDSAKLLVELVRTHPGTITLVCMGPLTNIYGASERYPEFLGELKQLLVMGGSVAVGGDATASAEFNILADVHAAKEVLTSPANKTLLPLDTTNKFGLSFDQYDQLGVDEFSRLGRLLDSLIPFALRACRTQLGQEGMLLPAVTAIAAISHSELFELTPMVVDVEQSGEITKGMTVFDRRGLPHWKENIEVLADVDHLGVLDYMMRLIGAAEVGE